MIRSSPFAFIQASVARQQRAAQAVADRIDLALAGRLLDRVERRERTLEHVVLEALVGELPSGLTQDSTNTV